MSLSHPTPPRYHIGIDLGTTHTVVAFRPMDGDVSVPIEIFKIDQFVLPGQREALPLLPSVRYHPKDEELDFDEVRLPWDKHPGSTSRVLIGEIARYLGARTQGRLIASAKSWLCHPGVDRMADILPFGSDPKDVLQVSPVEATASYLNYVRSAWNHHHPEALFEHQSIVITVPASFDEVSRRLTLEAAERAKLSRPLLMEEPQAAFYAFLWENQKNLEKALQGSNLLLVIDIGGGTLDLSLFEIEHKSPEFSIRRVSVGNHLMLGGDNLDHALARAVEAKLEDRNPIRSSRARIQLIEQCRLAKEQLLSDNAPERLPITLLGSGSRLVADSKTVELERDEVREQLLEGFFPLVKLEDRPGHSHHGLVDFGLPYARDPAVTRHLAEFLENYRSPRNGITQSDDLPLIPDTVLLNGGLVQSPIIAHRLVEQLEQWRGSKIKVLKNPDPRLSVALGAVASAQTPSKNNFKKIEAFASRSYYLRVEEDDGQSSAICVLPRGTPEGVTLTLEEHRFELKLGEMVRFDLLQARDNRTDAPGQWVELEFGAMNPLPPLIVGLSSELHRTPQVKLEVQMNTLGLMDLLLRDETGETWRLEFPLRPHSQSPQQIHTPHSPALIEARARIEGIFGKKQKAPNTQGIKTLRGDLERILGPRDEWDLPTLRGLSDALLEAKAFRKRSADHERLWLNWMGYCLRPGFGYEGDQARIHDLVDFFPQGIQYVKEARNWAEWWTLWRRIAGGLDAPLQATLADQLRPLFDASFIKRNPSMAHRIKNQSPEDGIRLLGALELLSPETKREVAEGLMLRSGREWNAPFVWALGRIGSRIPVYGPLECILPGQWVESWLDHLMKEDFKKHPDAAFASVLLARRTGDAGLDLEEGRVAVLIEKLQRAKCPSAWLDLIRNSGPWSEQDQKRLYGESLPPGLKRL